MKKIKLLSRIANDVPKIMVTDHNRLKQVLLNLVSNSIKNTMKGYVMIKVLVKKI